MTILKTIIDKAKLMSAICLTLIFVVNTANATTVRFVTSLGNIDVNLYDQTTPLSVANFLTYVNSSSYENTLFHRSINSFILQGGGFRYDNSWPASAIQANASVRNEPIYSNVRGTIAYAKLGNQPDSATNQWFFNLNNNSANLDNQNSGFTVFGEVTGSGMNVVDSIVALNTFSLGGAFTEIPLQNYTQGTDPNDTNIILITNVEILDSDVNTAAGLNPTVTTRPAASSGGGSLNTLLLLLLLFSRVAFRKNTFK